MSLSVSLFEKGHKPLWHSPLPPFRPLTSSTHNYTHVRSSTATLKKYKMAARGLCKLHKKVLFLFLQYIAKIPPTLLIFEGYWSKTCWLFSKKVFRRSLMVVSLSSARPELAARPSSLWVRVASDASK